MTAPWQHRQPPAPDPGFLWYARLPPPYGPDPVVFGPPQGPRPEPGYAGPEQHCPRHPGVTWRGGGGCWACPAGMTEFSSKHDD